MSSSVPTTPTWPLTTIFTAPASCAISSVRWSTCTEWAVSSSMMLVCGPSTSDDCLPTAFPTNGLTPIFSPGVCPTNYFVGQEIATADGPTTALCCPSGLTYTTSLADGIYTSICYTALTTERPPDGNSTPTTTDFAPVTTVTTDISRLSGALALQTVAYGSQAPLVVVWQSSDLASFTPASAPILAGASSTISAGVASTKSSSSTPPSTTETTATSHEQLSGGADAGIGIAAAVVVGIAIFGIIWMFRRRRHRQQQRDDGLMDAEPSFEEETKGIPIELGELDGSRSYGGPVEIEAPERHELEGDFHGHEVGGPKSPQSPQMSNNGAGLDPGR